MDERTHAEIEQGKQRQNVSGLEISVVTGTYNRLSSLKRFVESVRQVADPGLRYEIVLVDGGSEDGTIQWAKSQRDVYLIEQGELRGAISAFNVGAYHARGKYVLLANDDIEFSGSLGEALAFMQDKPHVGVGCFEQKIGTSNWHVNTMPALDPAGRPTRVLYGQVCLVPRWLGNECQWWGDFGAKTYGGDNYLSTRVLELGFSVEIAPGCRIYDHHSDDKLRMLNGMPDNGAMHPDSRAFYKMFPQGASLKLRPMLTRPADYEERTQRILYVPIYEPGYPVQQVQKHGLRDALAKIGIVREVDYLTTGAQSVLQTAKRFRPDFILTQFQDGRNFSAGHGEELRRICPNAMIVNWNGDYREGIALDPHYLELLKYVNLQTCVCASQLDQYARAGIPAVYWQIGYEPDGVDVEPDEYTPLHDVVFMGNCYSPERTHLGEALVSLDANVGIYGNGWPFGFNNGVTLYDFARGCQIYQNAKIAISDSQWPRAEGFVSNRLFQVMAAGGALLLQQEFSGMEKWLGLVNGVHLVTWTTLDDLKAKIQYYLSDDETRTKIALAGQLEVLTHHRFEDRVRQLLEIIHPKHDDPLPFNPSEYKDTGLFEGTYA